MAFEKIKCFVRFPKKSFQSLGGLGGLMKTIFPQLNEVHQPHQPIPACPSSKLQNPTHLILSPPFLCTVESISHM